MARDYRDPYAFPPPSPTLTNPDMILPFNHNTFAALPSPPREEHTSLLLESARDSDLGSYGLASGRRSGYLSARTPPPSNNRLSSTLSDIQEVEITPRKQVLVPVPRVVDTVASSPTLRDSYGTDSQLSKWRDAGHERRSSDSSSVLSEDLERMKWPGFDSGGMDEESVLDDEDDRHGAFPRVANGDDTIDDNAHMSDAQWLGSRPSDDDDEDDDPLSKRADLILANAKKRLNVCQGLNAKLGGLY
jgi:hypothetical protein